VVALLVINRNQENVGCQRARIPSYATKGQLKALRMISGRAEKERANMAWKLPSGSVPQNDLITVLVIFHICNISQQNLLELGEDSQLSSLLTLLISSSYFCN
jgi:exonuclease I